MKNSLTNLVQILLKKNQISFDKEELSFQIQSHPSFPSLHAITGVLNHFNIENVAADVPINKETLLQLPVCFLAQVETTQGQDLVVVEKKNTSYNIYYTKDKKEKLSENDFLKKFTGIIVAVEQSEEKTLVKTNSNPIKKLGLSILILLATFFCL